MATEQSTVDYILDQLSSLKDVAARKMFGEYAVYAEGKVVALVCDDTLYVKITEAGKEFVGADQPEGAAYPGAKPSFKIDPEKIEDSEWLAALIKITSEYLPAPKKKIKK